MPDVTAPAAAEPPLHHHTRNLENNENTQNTQNPDATKPIHHAASLQHWPKILYFGTENSFCRDSSSSASGDAEAPSYRWRQVSSPPPPPTLAASVGHVLNQQHQQNTTAAAAALVFDPPPATPCLDPESKQPSLQRCFPFSF